MAMLRPLSRDRAYPTRLVVFDCEGQAPDLSDGTHTLRLGVAQLWTHDPSVGWLLRGECVFNTPQSFIDYLDDVSNVRETLYVAAHNMAYDGQLLALPTLLDRAGWETRRAILTDHVWMHTLRRGRRRLVVFDTLQLLRAPVAELGRRLGTPKGDLPGPDAPEPAWIEYCRRDVEITARSLIAHIETLRAMQAGGLALTLAGQALLTYRRRYQRAPVALSRDERVMALEQAAYHGGRVECCRLGEWNTARYSLLDVNSMYPYVMLNWPVPTACLSYQRDATVSALSDALSSGYVIADVTVRMKDPAVPVVHDGRLVFPVGVFRTALHSSELELAIKHGEIVAVHAMACYRQEYIFDDYVKSIYRMKQDADRRGDAIARSTYKLLLNSLYGKFGQWKIATRKIPHPPGDALPGPLWSRYTGLDERGVEQPITVAPDGLLVEYRAGPTAHTHWGIAGAITARARRVLWDYIQAAGPAHVLYVDTDSLLVDGAGHAALTPYLSAVELGMLKLEQQSDHVAIHGPKDYEFGTRTKIKGVPRSAERLPDGRYCYAQFRGVRGWQRDGAGPGVRVRTVLKTLSREYRKGVLLADQFVAPLRLGETGAERGELQE